MQTPPPDLDDADVLGLVRAGWCGSAERARYLPVGYGSHHWAVDGSGGRWFVSADVVDGDRPAAALESAFGLAAAARRAGVAGAHGPVPGADGRLVAVRGRWAVSVQPWLDGIAGRFSEPWPRADDAIELVVLLAGLHGCPAPGLAAERPGIAGRAALERAVTDVAVARPLGPGPLADRVAALLHTAVPGVRDALAELDAAPPPDPASLVPTHGEPHPGNVVRTQEGLVLVDWDTARLGEPERDLWLVRDRTDVDVAAVYRELTGREPDADRMDARRLAWALTDVADFVPALAAAPTEDADTVWQLEALEETLAAL